MCRYPDIHDSILCSKASNYIIKYENTYMRTYIYIYIYIYLSINTKLSSSVNIILAGETNIIYIMNSQ